MRQQALCLSLHRLDQPLRLAKHGAVSAGGDALIRGMAHRRRHQRVVVSAQGGRRAGRLEENVVNILLGQRRESLCESGVIGLCLRSQQCLERRQ